MERVMLTTGGTGGHIFPALAVAEELRSRYPSSRILFVGGVSGPEGELARKAGLEFVGLPVEGVFGRGLRAARALFKLAVACGRALAVVGRFRPQVVVGFGGYASFAAVLAAALRRVPTAVHEQNSVPGMSNKFLGRWVKRVFLTFPDDRSAFAQRKTVLTGLPVRASIRELGKRLGENAVVDGADDAEPGRNLLVLGGSQGASAINDAVLAMLVRLRAQGIHLRHQAGARDQERVSRGYAALGEDPAMVSAFIQDMAEAYDWADLILCRAGASTVAEVAVAGKPGVFVPFPFATHGHQLANARALEQAGGALVVEQKDLERTDLAQLVLELMNDAWRLKGMGHAAKNWGRPDAAAHIVDQMAELAELSSKGGARKRDA